MRVFQPRPVFSQMEDDFGLYALSVSASDGVSASGRPPAPAAQVQGRGKRKQQDVGTPQSAKKKAAVAKPSTPCMVCGCIFAEMPPDCAFCRPHKRTVDVMNYRYGKIGKDRQTAFRKRQQNAPKEPPSHFATEVLEFDDQAPETEGNQSRNVVDMERHCEKFAVNTSVLREVVLQKMHHQQWMKNAVDVQCLPVHEAQAMWDEAEDKTPEEETDQLGPKDSRLRCPMPVQELIRARNEVMQSMEMQLGTKQKRALGNTVEQAMAYVFAGAMSFNDSVFRKVGGDAIKMVGSSGGCIIGARGEGPFAGRRTTAAPPWSRCSCRLESRRSRR